MRGFGVVAPLWYFWASLWISRWLWCTSRVRLFVHWFCARWISLVSWLSVRSVCLATTVLCGCVRLLHYAGYLVAWPADTIDAFISVFSV